MFAVFVTARFFITICLKPKMTKILFDKTILYIFHRI